jgi:hypothetical protein
MQLRELVRVRLNRAVAAPQHAVRFADDFTRLDGKMRLLTFRRVLLEEMQLRMEKYAGALAAENLKDASELLALVRLLGALHLRGLVPFHVIASSLESWLCEADSVPEALVEASALMVSAISPALRASRHGNMGRALELVVEERFTELMESDMSLYHPRVVSIVSTVLDLIASNWDSPGSVRVVQCVPAVGDNGSERVQFISISGGLVHEVCEEDASDVATLRMIVAEKLGLLEHLVIFISSDGRLLMSRDLT